MSGGIFGSSKNEKCVVKINGFIYKEDKVYKVIVTLIVRSLGYRTV
jgi:hypothetical protein